MPNPTEPRAKLRAVLALALVLLAAPTPRALGAGTGYWGVEGEKAVSRGTLKGVSLSSDGVLSLAPGLSPIDTTLDLYVWALVEGADGTVYAGTGDKGRIAALRAGSSGTLVSGADLEVVALAPGRGGRLLAGTAPSGLLLSILPASGGRPAAVDTLLKTAERYVWAVAPAADGTVFIGTGASGKIYRVAADRRSRVLYDTGDANVTSLRLRDGTLYATTDGRGLVLAVDPAGKPRVLYDAPESEVRCIAFDRDGNLYFAANGSASRGGEGQGSPQPPPARPSARPEHGEEEGVTVVAESPGAGGAKIYRMAPDGTVSVFWRLASGYIHALLAEEDGALLVGTGNPGGLHRVEKDGETWSRLLERKEQPFLALLRTKEGLRAGLGNPGSVAAVEPAPRDAGTYESEANDAGNVARWGKLRWTWGDESPRAGIAVRTRSGNTETPDSTWSEWSAPLTAAEGSDVLSPPARFLQWKAEFRGSEGRAPSLRAVRIAYVRRNAKPIVRNVDVSAQGDNLFRGSDPRPGVISQTLGSGARVEISLSERGSARPVADEEVSWVRRYRTLRWEAEDPDGDPLRFDLYFRGEGERVWKRLESDLTERGFTWDTGSVPDGRYRVEIAASDSGGNAPGEALRATATSESFVVDNTPPVVSSPVAERAGGGLRVKATVADRLSWIRRVQYALDSDDWRYVAPVDGIYDSPEEEVSFEIPGASADEHTIAVRAIDASGNVGAAKTVTR